MEQIKERIRTKWELLGFTDKQHYFGWAAFNGLDTTPFSGTVTSEDIEYLSYLMGDSNFEEDDEAVAEVVGHILKGKSTEEL